MRMLTTLLTRCMKDVAHIRSDPSAPSGLSGSADTSAPPDMASVASRHKLELTNTLLQGYFVSMASPKHVLALVSTPDVKDGASFVLEPLLRDLLHACLSFLLQFAETAILNVLSKDGPYTFKAPEHVVSILRFLLRVLAQLCTKTQASSNVAPACQEFVVAFSRRLLSECSELLAFCSRVGKWPADPAAVSSSLIDQKSKALRALHAVIGPLLILSLTSLAGMAVRVQDVTTLLPVLIQLATGVDSLTVGLPEVVSAEAELATGTVKWKRSTRTLIVETPHPAGSSSWTHFLQVPGASSLDISFDDQSRATLSAVSAVLYVVISLCCEEYSILQTTTGFTVISFLWPVCL